ncbi:c-type cytochrome [Cognaticolwellia mytili]|uniref:c-type cytochrome n=1 Tax=Cognaticolwellia mytili TaxID=1888913 RepID=UPI00130207CD|nr:c-type cytochrome [Cognaticolwellia mytili]
MLTVCKDCHGKNLSGQEMLNAPAIAGQSLLYLTRQIAKFRNGSRGKHKDDSTGQQMASIAITLNDPESLLEVNQYISRLTFIEEVTNLNTTKATASISQLRLGSNYYQAKCGACHGGNAQGNDKMLAPRLNHLSPTYLLKQMANFSNATRGGGSDDKYGRQMAMMAKISAGQELDNIIMFINSLTNKIIVSDDNE